ncbi:MAG: PhzF family phenazine biosynthesis protein [Candidatus Rokuibacteriota bacterium]|nr:MAG: PhzF family phenazine biosynthesis protein [Candidatus Rokubacteria bacterium]
MKTLAFQQVDVFTAVPFKGNPVAVVLDGDAVSSADMQSIAAWTNLSETTFVCTPTDQRADYRLRIFTPKRELPFAGHPTIGSAHAVLRHGLKPQAAGRLVQECGKGLVDIKIDGERLLLALPEPQFREPTLSQRAAVADGLGVMPADIQRAAIIDVGPVWFTVQLASADAIGALAPDMGKLAALNPIGITGVNVFGLYPRGASADVEVRSFAPGDGVPEDPVCGSGNGCVAALVRRDGVLKTQTYVASQGRCLGRDGQVTVQFDASTIWLGGHAVTCVEGVLQI